MLFMCLGGLLVFVRRVAENLLVLVERWQARRAHGTNGVAATHGIGARYGVVSTVGRSVDVRTHVDDGAPSARRRRELVLIRGPRIRRVGVNERRRKRHGRHHVANGGKRLLVLVQRATVGRRRDVWRRHVRTVVGRRSRVGGSRRRVCVVVAWGVLAVVWVTWGRWRWRRSGVWIVRNHLGATIYIATLTTQNLHTWTRAHVGKVSRVSDGVCVWREVRARLSGGQAGCRGHHGHYSVSAVARAGAKGV